MERENSSNNEAVAQVKPHPLIPLNKGKLFFILICPIFLSILLVAGNHFTGEIIPMYWVWGLIAITMTTMKCWLSIIDIVTNRFDGPSVYLLVFAYPLAQLIMIPGTLFLSAFLIYKLDVVF